MLAVALQRQGEDLYLLGGSWVVIGGVISRVTIVITQIRGLITPLPSKLRSTVSLQRCGAGMSKCQLRANISQSSGSLYCVFFRATRTGFNFARRLLQRITNIGSDSYTRRLQYTPQAPALMTKALKP